MKAINKIETFVDEYIEAVVGGPLVALILFAFVSAWWSTTGLPGHEIAAIWWK